MAKKSNFITMQVASALAEQVAEQLKEIKTKDALRAKQECAKSSVFKELSLLNKEVQKLLKQRWKLENELEEEYGVSINCGDYDEDEEGDMGVSLSADCYLRPDLKAIKSSSVLADQVKEIGAEDLVNYIITQQLSNKKKQTSCD